MAIIIYYSNQIIILSLILLLICASVSLLLKFIHFFDLAPVLPSLVEFDDVPTG